MNFIVRIRHSNSHLFNNTMSLFTSRSGSQIARRSMKTAVVLEGILKEPVDESYVESLTT